MSSTGPTDAHLNSLINRLDNEEMSQAQVAAALRAIANQGPPLNPRTFEDGVREGIAVAAAFRTHHGTAATTTDDLVPTLVYLLIVGSLWKDSMTTGEYTFIMRRLCITGHISMVQMVLKFVLSADSDDEDLNLGGGDDDNDNDNDDEDMDLGGSDDEDNTSAPTPAEPTPAPASPAEVIEIEDEDDVEVVDQTPARTLSIGEFTVKSDSVAPLIPSGEPVVRADPSAEVFLDFSQDPIWHGGGLTSSQEDMEDVDANLSSVDEDDLPSEEEWDMEDDHEAEAAAEAAAAEAEAAEAEAAPQMVIHYPPVRRVQPPRSTRSRPLPRQ
jgi:hypothetical protein